jgi:hypothetical protein
MARILRLPSRPQLERGCASCKVRLPPDTPRERTLCAQCWAHVEHYRAVRRIRAEPQP